MTGENDVLVGKASSFAYFTDGDRQTNLTSLWYDDFDRLVT